MARTESWLFHDLGHELGTILMLVEAIRLDVDAEPVLMHRLNLLELAVGRVESLIEVCAEHRPASDPVRTPMRDVLSQIVETRALTVPTTVVLCPGPPVCLPAEPALIWRLVANLVDNAVRAAGAEGRVELELLEGPPVVVQVRDDGPGFGHGPHGRGGLGLDIVRSLAAALGAELGVRDGEGGGTTMEVVFWDAATESALVAPANRKQSR